MKILHKAAERGAGNYGWLTTRYGFSFADWYDPSRMGFGALRVINDDIIAPANGFGEHSHWDMEIITIVTRGTVTHKDSIGNAGAVPAGDVQVMSAGTGVTHSEYNESETETLELFQIWIESKERGIAPRYAQKSFSFLSTQEGLVQLVEPTGKEGLAINQDAYIVYVAMAPGATSQYQLHSQNSGAYVFVIEGKLAAEGEELFKRDALGVSGQEFIFFSSVNGAKLLIIEVPMKG